MRHIWFRIVAMIWLATGIGCSMTPEITEPTQQAEVQKSRPRLPQETSLTGLSLDTSKLALAQETDYSADESDEAMRLVIQGGHAGSIRTLGISQNGRIIATAGGDDRILIWNREGVLLREIEKGRVLRATQMDSILALSRDGKYVAVVFGGLVKIFHTVTGADVGSIRWTDKRDEPGERLVVNGLAFGPMGQNGEYTLFAGALDGEIRIYHLTLSVGSQQGKVIRNFGGVKLEKTIRDGGPVLDLDLSRDGKRIVTLSGGGNNFVPYAATLWSADGTRIRSLEKPQDAESRCAVSPDGELLAVGGFALHLASADGKMAVTLVKPGDKDRQVTSMRFSADSQYLIAGFADGSLRVWSRTGKYLGRVASPVSAAVAENESNLVPPSVFDLAVAADGASVVSSSGPFFNLWSLEDGRLITAMKKSTAHGDKVVISDNGRRILAHALLGKTSLLRLWSIEGRPLAVISRGGEWVVDSFALSPDGTKIAALDSEHTLTLWEANGTLLREMKNPALKEQWIGTVNFSQDGARLIVSVTQKEEPPRGLIFTLDGKLERKLEPRGTKTEDHGIAISPRLDAFVTWEHWSQDRRNPAFTLRSMDGNPLAQTNQLMDVGAVGFGSNTDNLWVAADKHLYHWSGRAPNKTLESDSNAYLSGYITFSPDAQRYATWNYSVDEHNTFVDNDDYKKIVTGVALGPGDLRVVSFVDGAILVTRSGPDAGYQLLAAGDEWIMFTPDYLFDASPKGGSLVAMVRGITAFGVDQFALKNNRPDLILGREKTAEADLINHYHAQYLRRLKKAGFNEEQLKSDVHVPSAKIDAREQKGKVADLTFTFADSLFPLKRYNVFVNDVPLFGAYGKNIKGKTFETKESIELTAGLNKVEVSATNDAGAESLRALAYFQYDKPAPGDLYFLGFGISKFKNPDLALQFADKDARDLAQAFGRMGSPFQHVYTKVLQNEEVSPEAIKAAKSFVQSAKVDDTFVLFVAGHGLHDRDEAATYYYLTYASDLSNLRETAADFDLIEDLAQGIAPRAKLLLMDTCESGEAEQSIEQESFAMAQSRGIRARTARGLKVVDKGGAAAPPPRRGYLFEKDRYIYNDLMRRSGAIVFSSSRGGEFSYESESIGNGFFTREVGAALTSAVADEDKNGQVSTEELRRYVSKKVAEQTADHQHPTVDRDNIFQRFAFPVTKAK